MNVDEDDPVVSLQPDEGGFIEEVTVEASPDGIYTDPGAVCVDWHHHPITISAHGDSATGMEDVGDEDGHKQVALEELAIGGDIVDMSVPDVYHVTYTCVDGQGRDAVDAVREVTVVDSTKPTIELQGASTIFVEAGFEYQDDWATASDTLDGQIDDSVYTQLEETDVSDASSGSMDALLTGNVVAHPKVGTYVLSFLVNDNAENPQVQVEHRTIIVQDTLAPVISLKAETTEGNWETLHVSSANDLGVNDEQNLAGVGQADGGSNPFVNTNLVVMAETATSGANTWVVGGVASALTGLALLAFSQSKTTTAVPV
jgi:hypothetical protein